MANSYIVDSGNNYTLYVDQGTEFKFSVPFSAFGIIGTVVPRTLSANFADLLATGSILDNLITIIEPQVISNKGIALDIGNGNTLTSNGIFDSEIDYHVNGLTFTGIARQYQTSKKYVEFDITTDLINGKLNLSLSATASYELTYPRYNFAVYYTNAIGNTVKAFGGSIIMSQNLTH